MQILALTLQFPAHKPLRKWSQVSLYNISKGPKGYWKVTFRAEPTHLGKGVEMTLWLDSILLAKFQSMAHHISIHSFTESGGKWSKAKAIKISQALGSRGTSKAVKFLEWILMRSQPGLELHPAHHHTVISCDTHVSCFLYKVLRTGWDTQSLSLLEEHWIIFMRSHKNNWEMKKEGYDEMRIIFWELLNTIEKKLLIYSFTDLKLFSYI